MDKKASFTPFLFPMGLQWNMHYEMADMDNDGDMDVFVKGKNEESRGFVYWLENDENHSFEVVHFIAEDISSLGTTTATDINADGYPDLVYIYNSPSQLVWLMNDGTGNMTQEERVIEPEFSYIQNAVFGDIDADGDMDMVGTYFSQYHVKINDGEGNFELFYILNDAIAGLTISDIAITDLDGDYHNDLLIRDGNTALYWLENILDKGIQGRVFMDFNENGIYDEGDAPLVSQKLKLQPLKRNHHSFGKRLLLQIYATGKFCIDLYRKHLVGIKHRHYRNPYYD